MFTDDNNLYFGKTGVGGNPSAINAIQESDFILALGTRFPTKVIINEKYFANKANSHLHSGTKKQKFMAIGQCH